MDELQPEGPSEVIGEMEAKIQGMDTIGLDEEGTAHRRRLHQVQEGDFWPSIEAHRRPGNPDAAADVYLRLAFDVKPLD
jgi:hypothetical protein